MTYTEKLISFHVVERELHRNFLSWTYPTIAEDQKNYILEHCFVNNEEYTCLPNNKVWFNIKQATCERDFAIIIITKDFEPIKYETLCDVLAKKYSKCQNPVDLVALYLNLCTVGYCSFQENGTTHLCNFKHFEISNILKEFILSFDIEVVLIYTAVLLKRRIILYSADTPTLLKDLTAVNNLVPHRKTDDCLFPLIENARKLKGLSFYVAGTTNFQIIKEEDFYDIFVNTETKQIAISPKAGDVMAVSKTHKEIATFLVKLATSDLSANEMKKQIFQKTKDLLAILQNIASATTQKNMISISDLKAKKLHPKLEAFLFNLALAENMMML